MVLRSQRGRVAVPPQEYNEERFEELVLYIAWETREDPDFGRTKLAKVLFYSDFTAYLDEGKAFTGARYEAWPNGPFPPVLYDVEKALAAEGRAKVERLDVGPDRGEYEPYRILPNQPPATTHFESWELLVVDQWIRQVTSATATKISDLSHEHPGWRLAQGGGEIPYASALISTDPLSPRALEIAERRFATPGGTTDA